LGLAIHHSQLYFGKCSVGVNRHSDTKQKFPGTLGENPNWMEGTNTHSLIDHQRCQEVMRMNSHYFASFDII